MTWHWILLTAGLVAVTVTACGALSPEQQQQTIAALDEALRAGRITAQQHAAAREAVMGGTGELADLGREALRTGIDVGLALLGVRVWRGGIASRRGAPPS